MTESQAQQAPQPAWASLVARAGLSPARRRVLRAVQESASPVSAAELAQDLGLHHNTVREHLESLVKQGMVSMTPVSTGRRGRPTLRYQVTAPDPIEVLVSYTTLLDAVAQTLGEGEEARQVALTRRSPALQRGPPTPRRLPRVRRTSPSPWPPSCPGSCPWALPRTWTTGPVTSS